MFFISSRRRHTRWNCDWSSDVCSSDLPGPRACRAGWRRTRPRPPWDRSQIGRASCRERMSIKVEGVNPEDKNLDKLDQIPQALPSFQKLLQVLVTGLSIL